MTGHQVYHLQSPRYDLVVGSENPSSFGVSKAFLASDSAEDNLITVLSKEHALLDMFTDYLTGESAILLFQGGPLREPVNDWKHAQWFGYYRASDYPWIYSSPLGWVYVHESMQNGVWLWHGESGGREKLGWIWTNFEVYPYFFLPSISRWSYYNDNEVTALFYDYDEREWFDSNKAMNISYSTNLPLGGIVDGMGQFYRWQKTQISVLTNPNFSFAGWSGDYSGFSNFFEMEVLKDENLHANFVPLANGTTSVSEVMKYAVDVIQTMENLTEVEKERSIAELLRYGSSSTAGFSIKE